mgnify:CR=1 FL=1
MCAIKIISDNVWYYQRYYHLCIVKAIQLHETKKNWRVTQNKMFHLALKTGEGKVSTKHAQCKQTSRSGRFCTTLSICKKDKFKEVSVLHDNKYTCKKCLKIAIAQGRF